MRIGLVGFLNAHPLDYGIRQSTLHEITIATPAVLVNLLLAGKLDTALISSVECLRHPELHYSTAAGVASDGAVDSILYFEKPSNSFCQSLPAAIYCDSGSRSSVSLLQILMAETFGNLPETITMDPGLIPELVQKKGHAGLLIGDNALAFADSPQARNFSIRDLGAWWQETQGLPFVYALWAGLDPLDDNFFLQSLAAGLEHLDQIASLSPYSRAREYLKQRLHFRLSQRDQAGLARFRELLLRWQLL